VTSTNTRSAPNPSAARSRGPSGSRPVASHTAARNTATFPPETATKWSRPARRISSRRVGRTAAVSPIRNPRMRAPDSVAAGNSVCTLFRIALAKAIGPRAAATGTTDRATTHPPMGDRCSRPLRALSRPRICTVAPTVTSGSDPTDTPRRAPSTPADPPATGSTANSHPERPRAGSLTTWASKLTIAASAFGSTATRPATAAPARRAVRSTPATSGRRRTIATTARARPHPIA